MESKSVGTNEYDHLTQDVIKILIPGKEHEQMHYFVKSLGEQALQDTTEGEFLVNCLNHHRGP